MHSPPTSHHIPPVIPNHWDIHWVGLPLGSEPCNLCPFSTLRQKKILLCFSESFDSLSSLVTYIVYNLKISWLKNSSAFMLSSLTFLFTRILYILIFKFHVFSHTKIRKLADLFWCSTAIFFSSPVFTPACFQIPRNRNILKEEVADICSSLHTYTL